MSTRSGALVVAAVALGLALLPTAASADSSTGSDDGLWYLTRTGVDDAHARTLGTGVTIGVVDGPVDPDAPDLRGADLVVHEPSFCATGSHGTSWAPATATSAVAQHATGMAELVAGTGAGAGPVTGADSGSGAAAGGGAAGGGAAGGGAAAGVAVAGVAPGARVVTYAVLTGRADTGAGVATVCPRHAGDERGWLEGAIDAAIADHVDILSISMTGDVAEPGAIARALHAGIVVVAAQAHGGATPAYPASSNGVLAVESSGPDGALAQQATVDPANTVVAPGQEVRQPSADLRGYVTESGASPATAWTAGVLALAWSQHRDATGNQVLQALLRSTDRRDDGWGLGAVDVNALLAQDPTVLPDVNPLVREGALPSADQLAAPPAATAGPPAGTTPEAAVPRTQATASVAGGGRPVSPGRRGAPVGLLVGGGILALVAALGAGALTARRTASQRATRVEG